MIANHCSSKLSDLDLSIAYSVPPGGNWKNIPENIPSERIRKIRISFNAGEGSRSTYYGRLKPDAPAYTINTYFSRPGNGCHLHYDFLGGQHRTLSYREAARLQSFPDDFIFQGSKVSIGNQIGNAVPPILAFQIAKSLPFKGVFLDLFCGAGGLALGFKWAGWQSIVGNDIEASFLKTYQDNIHSNVLCGDIRDDNVFEAILRQVEIFRKENGNDVPLFVLGGPPCQGFSTAGKKRSNSDERNWLFEQYRSILEKVKPDGFIFENVTGIISMEGGQFFKMIKNDLEKTIERIAVWKLQAEEYGVPQRRTRIIIVGDNTGKANLSPPEKITRFGKPSDLFSDLPLVMGVENALSDLPPLKHNEDGSQKQYLCEPKNIYQELMRSTITVEEYIDSLTDYNSAMSSSSSEILM